MNDQYYQQRGGIPWGFVGFVIVVLVLANWKTDGALLRMALGQLDPQDYTTAPVIQPLPPLPADQSLPAAQPLPAGQSLPTAGQPDSGRDYGETGAQPRAAQPQEGRTTQQIEDPRLATDYVPDLATCQWYAGQGIEDPRCAGVQAAIGR